MPASLEFRVSDSVIHPRATDGPKPLVTVIREDLIIVMYQRQSAAEFEFRGESVSQPGEMLATVWKKSGDKKANNKAASDVGIEKDLETDEREWEIDAEFLVIQPMQQPRSKQGNMG